MKSELHLQCSPEAPSRAPSTSSRQWPRCGDDLSRAAVLLGAASVLFTQGICRSPIDVALAYGLEDVKA